MQITQPVLGFVNVKKCLNVFVDLRFLRMLIALNVFGMYFDRKGTKKAKIYLVWDGLYLFLFAKFKRNVVQG